MESEDFVRNYIEAVAANDFETMKKRRHPDWHEDWPQSGERVPSHDAYRAIHENFPGGMPRVELTDVARGRGPLGHDTRHDDPAHRRKRRRVDR